MPEECYPNGYGFLEGVKLAGLVTGSYLIGSGNTYTGAAMIGTSAVAMGGQAYQINSYTEDDPSEETAEIKEILDSEDEEDILEP